MKSWVRWAPGGRGTQHTLHHRLYNRTAGSEPRKSRARSGVCPDPPSSTALQRARAVGADAPVRGVALPSLGPSGPVGTFSVAISFRILLLSFRNKIENRRMCALAGWLSWLKHCPIYQKFAGSIPGPVPGQGTYLGCRFDPWSGHEWEATSQSLSLCPAPSLPLSLKSIPSGEDPKNIWKTLSPSFCDWKGCLLGPTCCE